MLSVAAQIAHAAHTVDWFITGAFSPQGFDLDFAAHERAANSENVYVHYGILEVNWQVLLLT